MCVPPRGYSEAKAGKEDLGTTRDYRTYPREEYLHGAWTRYGVTPVISQPWYTGRSGTRHQGGGRADNRPSDALGRYALAADHRYDRGIYRPL